MYQSPLNYTGGKFKLLSQILPLFPEQIDTFVDLFCGGCNVGLNVNANSVLYNDADEHLKYLFQMFKNLDKSVTFDLINQVIDEYGLSRVSEHSYEFYGCNGGDGLGSYNKDKFLKLRADYNAKSGEDYYKFIMLYVLIVYAFNNQIRFNSNGEFNLPVGKRDFNVSMIEKLSSFIDRVKEQDCYFSSVDFREVNTDELTPNDFVYADPPYLITCATYNEQDGWSESDECDLLAFLDDLDERHIRFALSNVLRSKGKQNDILITWAQQNAERYRLIHLNHNYSNSNYHTKDKISGSDEVLIVNYGGED